MTMPPDDTEARLLLNAYVDGELDAASALAFEQRLAAEPDLERERERLLALKALLRDAMPSEAASDGLRRSLARIGLSASVEDSTGTSPWRARLGRIAPRLQEWRMGLAAGLVGLIVGGGLATLLMPARQATSTIADAVSDHLRAVMASQPFDVASSDQHTVKPWFTGRLSFAPQVFDLASAGFPLIGGRVDVLDGQPAAALAFRHGRHVISLLSQPAGASAASRSEVDRGFQVRSWTSGGMRYLAVSDVASEELDAFEMAAKAALARGE